MLYPIPLSNRGYKLGKLRVNFIMPAWIDRIYPSSYNRMIISKNLPFCSWYILQKVSCCVDMSVKNTYAFRSSKRNVRKARSQLALHFEVQPPVSSHNRVELVHLNWQWFNEAVYFSLQFWLCLSYWVVVDRYSLSEWHYKCGNRIESAM